jgi:hypothetical protein
MRKHLNELMLNLVFAPLGYAVMCCVLLAIFAWNYIREEWEEENPAKGRTELPPAAEGQGCNCVVCGVYDRSTHGHTMDEVSDMLAEGVNSAA